MRQFVISRHRQIWGTEYTVTGFKSKEFVLHAIHNQGWKNRIDAYEADGASKFTLKCRDLFGLTYDLADTNGRAAGLLSRQSWFSPLLQVSGTRRNQTAQINRVSPSLYEEFSLDLDGKAVCLFRKADGYSNPLVCCCLDESQISLDLMLAAGILLLGQGPSDGVGGAG